MAETDDAYAVLFYLAAHGESTTSDIAKGVFDPEDDTELRKADRRVRYYLTDKFDHLVHAQGENPTRYTAADSVEGGLGRVEIQSFSGDAISIALGGVVVYPDEDETPRVSVVGDVDIVDDSTSND